MALSVVDRGRRLAGMAACAAFKYVQAPGSTQPVYPPARISAWEKISPRMHAADQAGKKTASRHRESVQAFFAERKGRRSPIATKTFGEEVAQEFAGKTVMWGPAIAGGLLLGPVGFALG